MSKNLKIYVVICHYITNKKDYYIVPPRHHHLVKVQHNDNDVVCLSFGGNFIFIGKHLAKQTFERMEKF